MKLTKQAFTLVELIVVITILAVLGTIAFLSFQSYTVYARDVVRLSNLKNLESGLQIQYTKGGYYAVPDDFVNITASGTIIRQQGVFGPNSLRTIQANTDASKDPLTEQYYDYVTDAYQSEYQLVGYMESNEAMNVGTAGLLSLQGTHASGTGFIMKTLGQDMGIVSTGGVDLHRTESNIGQSFDIRNNAGVEYKIVFDETDEITSSSGSELFSNVYNRSKKLLKNKELAKLDDSLVLYLDMETTVEDGGILKMKDFSHVESLGTCRELTTITDCGTEPLFVFDDYQGGKALMFAGSGFIDFGHIEDLNFTNFPFTMSWVGDGRGGEHSHSRLLSNGSYKSDGWEVFHRKSRIKARTNTPGEYHQESVDLGAEDDLNNYVLVWKSDVIELYMNGQLLSVMPGITPPASNPGSFHIGHYSTHGAGINKYNFLGRLYEVRIYNRALLEKEIKTIYGSTLK